ncbi:MAG: 6-bladed beta-propeller [Gemmatimonadales bacterium]|nr:6-bladed beta-propeller [Gemmatimonadales bacterium]
MSLVESGDGMLGAYASMLTRDSSGKLYVSDMTSKRVVAFGPDGRVLKTFGRSGEGPGEFRLPGALHVFGDTLLMVHDPVRERFLQFDLRSGDLISERHATTDLIAPGWAIVGDSIFAGVVGSEGIVSSWSADEADLRPVVPLPAELRGQQGIMMRYGVPRIAVVDSNVLVLIPGRAGLHFYSTAGEARGRLLIPASRRRGEPLDLVARQIARSRESPGEIVASLPAGVHKLTSGLVLVAMQDMELIAGVGRNAKYGDFATYVSLIDLSRMVACVDGKLPISSDVPLIPIFRGDTMFLLGRVATPDLAVRSQLYSFTIDDAGCTWLPIGWASSP